MTSFAVGASARTASGMFTGEFVEIGLQLARGKLFASFDLLAPFPPIRIFVIEYALGAGVSLAEVWLFLLTIRGY